MTDDGSVAGALRGCTAVVTASTTREALDPVRFLTNASTGKQGYAIAEALRDAGVDVTLVSGPSPLAPPSGVRTVRIVTAEEMDRASRAALPADIAVCTAAVSDWRFADPAPRKLKKNADGAPVVLTLVENPDVLRGLCAAGPLRPRLVVGFAAETDHVLENARSKRRSKGCDWIVANDVSPEGRVPGVFGGDHNQVHLITAERTEDWPLLPKQGIADRLVAAIAAEFAGRVRPGG